MQFNQGITPNWNTLYPAILNKITKSVLVSNKYTSPFSQMVQKMETGVMQEDIHLNPSNILLHDTVTNSSILSSYIDDIATSYYRVNVDLQYPSSYTEYIVNESANFIENVTALTMGVVSNLRVTLEYHRNNLVKQMLYNAYQYGMLSSVTISDPRIADSGEYVVAMNKILDDFTTEMNTRNTIYNNQIGLDESEYRVTRCTEPPYAIVFNEFIRNVEFYNAINLALINKFSTGNDNQDYADRIIKLTFEDFPNSIPATARDDVTGTNVSANDINFFPMPRDDDDNDLFDGVATGGDTILGFVLDPRVLKLVTQLEVSTSFINPATLEKTNREIYRGIMDLGAFNKICAITCNAGATVRNGEMVYNMARIKDTEIDDTEIDDTEIDD